MRLDDWQSRLDDVISLSREKKFSWGDNDCFTFINAIHEALKGEPIDRDWASGKYQTAYQAKKYYLHLIKKTGIENIVLGIDSKLQRLDCLCPRRGSIVARRASGTDVLGYSFGVVVSDKCAFLGGSGLEFLPVSRGDLFWSVE